MKRVESKVVKKEHGAKQIQEISFKALMQIPENRFAQKSITLEHQMIL
jgi:hypothetical protein